jgi:hypothetical protein
VIDLVTVFRIKHLDGALVSAHGIAGINDHADLAQNPEIRARVISCAACETVTTFAMIAAVAIE